MEFIKLFEDYNKDEIVEKIKKVWGVDPHHFYDIIMSSMTECDLFGSVYIDFSLLHKQDFKVCYRVTDSDIILKPYSNNLNEIIKYNHLVIIEVSMDISEDWSHNELISDVICNNFESFNIPYSECDFENINNQLCFIFQKKDSN